MKYQKVIQIFCTPHKIDMCKYNVRNTRFDLEEEVISIYIWEDTQKLDLISNTYQIPDTLEEYYCRLNNFYI